MSIKKEIFVTRKSFDTCIDITYGTDIFPIELRIADYVLPGSSIAVAYAIKQDKSGELKKSVCEISDNTIILNPKPGFFDLGKNMLQIRITASGKELYTYKGEVMCYGNIVSDDAKEVEDNPTLMEQILSTVGEIKEEVGTKQPLGSYVTTDDFDQEKSILNKSINDKVALEKEERIAAINAEEAERKREIAVERARIDTIAALPEGANSSDFALEDIKVKFNGETADTPGNAVREQVLYLDKKIDDETSRLSEEIEDYFHTNNFEWEIGGFSYVNNTETEVTNMCKSALMPITSGSVLACKCLYKSGLRVAIAYYDENKNKKAFDTTYWDKALNYEETFSCNFNYADSGYVRLLVATNSYAEIAENIFDNIIDSFRINKVDINAFLIYSAMPFVTPEMFGAVGDGVTDDYVAIYNMLNSGHKRFIFGKNKAYYFETPIIVSNLNDVIINGQNATLQFKGNSSAELNDDESFFEIKGSRNVEITDLTFDGGNEWIVRPYSDEENYEDWRTQRTLTYNALRITSCNTIKVKKCKCQNSRTGFFVLSANNITISDSVSYQTMADGVFISGGSTNVLVTNHYCENVDDDNYTAIGYMNVESSNPSNVTFRDCTSKNSFGALVCLYGSTYTQAINCHGVGNCYAPVKLGSMKNTDNNWVCQGHDQMVDNCIVKLSTKIEMHGLASHPIINSTEDYISRNITIQNCNFEYENSENKCKFYATYSRGVLISNCKFDYVDFQLKNCEQVIIENSKFTQNTPLTIEKSNVSIVHNIFTNKKNSWNDVLSCSLNLINAQVECVANIYNRNTNGNGAKNIALNGDTSQVITDTNLFYLMSGLTSNKCIKSESVFDNILDIMPMYFVNGQLVYQNNNLFVVIGDEFVAITK